VSGVRPSLSTLGACRRGFSVKRNMKACPREPPGLFASQPVAISPKTLANRVAALDDGCRMARLLYRGRDVFLCAGGV